MSHHIPEYMQLIINQNNLILQNQSIIMQNLQGTQMLQQQMNFYEQKHTYEITQLLDYLLTEKEVSKRTFTDRDVIREKLAVLTEKAKNL